MIIYNILVVCSAPYSLAISVQVNDNRPYEEGEVVIFQCMPGMGSADVMIATSTLEGSWRSDPILLNCSSTTTNTIKSARGIDLL